MKYFDLKIRISANAHEYKVSTTGGANANDSQVDELVQFDKASLTQPLITYDPNGTANPIEYIQKRGGLFDPDTYDRTCRTIGYALFDTFFVRQILTRYNAYLGALSNAPDQGGPQLRIFIPDDLHDCPWELLRSELRLNANPAEDLQLYLARSGMIIRYANKDDVPLRAVTGRVNPPLSLLYIFAMPRPKTPLVPLDITSDRRISRVPRKVAKTHKDFRNNISKAKGFLFHGHAENTSKGAVLWFENSDGEGDQVPAWQIGTQTRNYLTEIVMLSACQTATFSGNMFANSAVGQILINGYPALITANQTDINAWAGAAFAKEFVANLYNFSLAQCVRAGRDAILLLDDEKTLEDQRASRDWWVPVIYASTRNPEVMFQNTSPELDRLGAVG